MSSIEQNLRKSAHLFTDATLTSWGAILVLPDGRVFVVGGKFEDGKDEPIHVREGQAVAFAFGHFYELLASELKLGNLQEIFCHVDNTTVEHNIRRGTVKVDAMQPIVEEIIARTFELSLPLIMERVGTKENPADEISRLEDLKIEKLLLALEKGKLAANDRLGGSAAKLFVFPSASVTKEIKCG